MNNKRIVITGSPGAGKTSLIRELSKKGYYAFDEYSRTLIEEGKEKGKSNIFLSDPYKFSERLFSGRKKQFESSEKIKYKPSMPYIFFDRGIQDILAYLEAHNKSNSNWKKRIKDFQYDLVFLVEPWEEIFQKDSQRMETFEQAKKYFPFIEKTYLNNHKVVRVPKMSIAERINFIEKYLSLYE